MCTGAGEARGEAWGLARVAKLGACVVGTGNLKRLRIDLGGEACKGRVTASEIGCNTRGK